MGALRRVGLVLLGAAIGAAGLAGYDKWTSDSEPTVTLRGVVLDETEGSGGFTDSGSTEPQTCRGLRTELEGGDPVSVVDGKGDLLGVGQVDTALEINVKVKPGRTGLFTHRSECRIEFTVPELRTGADFYKVEFEVATVTYRRSELESLAWKVRLDERDG